MTNSNHYALFFISSIEYPGSYLEPDCSCNWLHKCRTCYATKPRPKTSPDSVK